MQLPDVLPGEPQRGDDDEGKMSRGGRGVTGPGGGTTPVKKEASDTKVCPPLFPCQSIVCPSSITPVFPCDLIWLGKNG